MITSPADDPRYRQASAKLGELQTKAAQLREQYELALIPTKVSIADDAKALLSGGALATAKEAAEVVYRQLAAHEAAVQLQQMELGKLNAEISREICTRLRPTADAKRGKFVDALKALKAANGELVAFQLELERRGVQSIFPNLGIGPVVQARIDQLLTEHRQYVG